MRKRSQSIFLTLAVLATSGAASAAPDNPASPAPGDIAPDRGDKTDGADKAAQEEGRAHFVRAVELYRDADFRAALIEFTRAYEVAPNYRVQYNIGQTALELQDYAGALQAFEKYLRDGGSEIPAARRTATEATVQHVLASTTVSGKTRYGYFYDLTPRTDVEETNEGGRGFIINLPPGNTTLTAVFRETGEKMGEVSVGLRKGFVTGVQIAPSK